MKNFYVQQDTNLNINLTLSPIKDKEFPYVIFTFDTNIIHEGILTETASFALSKSFLEAFDLSVELKHKNYDVSPGTAVSISSLRIDDFEIVPGWTQLASYENDSKMSGPTNYIGYNGTWKLQVPEPFYRWRHKTTGQGWLLEP